MALQPRQSQQFTPNRFFDPDSDFAPQASTPAQPAPQPGDIAKASDPSAPPQGPQTPAQQFFSGPNPSSPPSAAPSAAPGYDEWHQQHGDAPVAGAPVVPHHGKLASIMLGVGEALGNPLATRIGQRDRELQQNYNDYERELPVTQYKANRAGYEEDIGNQQKNAQTRLANTEADVAGQNLPAQEQAAKIFSGWTQRWQQAIDPDMPSFMKYVNTEMAAQPYAVQRRLQEHIGAITQLPQVPPRFNVKDGTLEPLLYKGRNYGAAAEANEPPEVTQARNSGWSSLQESQLKSLDPIIRGQLGEPPKDPKELATYMHKAEAIKTRMAAAPRIEMVNQKPVEVADPNTGAVTYQRAGKAIDSGAQAPQSIPFSTEKAAARYFTTGAGAQQKVAFDTAIGHLNTLEKAGHALGNGDVVALNQLGNALGVQFGQDNATNFNAVKNVVAGEIAKVIKGNATEGEMHTVDQMFSSSASPEQLQGAINYARELLGTKRDALETQRNAGMQGKDVFAGGAQTAHTIAVGKKKYKYNGSGDTADMKNYTEIK